MTESVKAAPVVTEHEEKISEQDKHQLDLMIMSRKLAISNAEKFIAENKASESSYQLALYQLYSKYAMDLQHDAIDESGMIKRGAVKPQ